MFCPTSDFQSSDSENDEVCAFETFCLICAHRMAHGKAYSVLGRARARLNSSLQYMNCLRVVTDFTIFREDPTIPSKINNQCSDF